jgi:hypothetical protein
MSGFLGKSGKKEMGERGSNMEAEIPEVLDTWLSQVSLSAVCTTVN